MKAEIYRVIVCDNAIDRAHGLNREITELYVPSKKIAFNENADTFHCFVTERDRYKTGIKVGEINVPKAISQALIAYINVSKRLRKTKKWYKRCVLNFNANRRNK